MKRLVVVLLVACLAQTVTGQKYQRPQVQTPGTFRGDTATQPDSQSLANLKWFELFQDEKLQKLIKTHFFQETWPSNASLFHG